MVWTRRTIYVIAVGLWMLILFAQAGANPIPVQPHPQTNLPGFSGSEGVTAVWVLGLFVIDFFLDTLIVYAGIILLDRLRLIHGRMVIELPKPRFFSAVLCISIVGIASEWVFGLVGTGLFISLSLIFLSFLLVSRYLFRVSWVNAALLSVFALLVNAAVWSLLFII